MEENLFGKISDIEKEDGTVILSFRVTENLNQKFKMFCMQHKTTTSRLLRAMMSAALEKNTTDITTDDVDLKMTKTIFTEEEVVSYIFANWRLEGGNINSVSEYLLNVMGIPKKFSHHCHGRMILSGVKL